MRNFIGWLSLLTPAVLGHGTMSFPPTRNTVTSFNCPTCANGPSVCGSGSGSQWIADDAQASALQSTLTTPLVNLVAGGKVEVEMYFTAAHNGHAVLELCANPGPVITNDCFERLERDPEDNRFSPYLPDHPHILFFPDNSCVGRFTSSNPMRARFIMPAGPLSEHAVLRWQWQTGNSCDAMPETFRNTVDPRIAAWSNNIYGGRCQAAISGIWVSCGNDCPNPTCRGEHFRTCADVRIVSGDPSTVVSSGSAAPNLPPTVPSDIATTRPPVTTTTRPSVTTTTRPSVTTTTRPSVTTRPPTPTTVVTTTAPSGAYTTTSRPGLVSTTGTTECPDDAEMKVRVCKSFIEALNRDSESFCRPIRAERYDVNSFAAWCTAAGHNEVLRCLRALMYA